MPEKDPLATLKARRLPRIDANGDFNNPNALMNAIATPPSEEFAEGDDALDALREEAAELPHRLEEAYLVGNAATVVELRIRERQLPDELVAAEVNALRRRKEVLEREADELDSQVVPYREALQEIRDLIERLEDEAALLEAPLLELSGRRELIGYRMNEIRRRLAEITQEINPRPRSVAMSLL